MKRFQHTLAYLPSITNGENVVSWCSMIAKAANAKRVDLITCVEDYLPEYPEAVDTNLLESENARLSALQKHFDSPTETEVIIENGGALKHLLHRLAEGHYDLVVLPVNDDASRLFAERLARKSPVGVLAVPPTCPPRFRSILTAIDLSNLSEMSLSWAEAFSSLTEKKTELKALNIMKMPEGSRATLAIDPESLRNQIYRTSEQHLKNLIDQYTTTPEQWQIAIAEHPLASVQIVKEAHTNEADLVVIGSHGRGALSVALIGGQTAEVIRHCERPVLVVKKKNESLGFLRQLIGLSS